ncbi:beta family protein [Runella sp.]|uniref:beta family protein n=1 Tax=Runella sp. TaxID=1960881 RepID=UPI003D0C7AB8
MTNIRYYPLMRSKAGELEALKLLAPDIKSSIAPIIQILPPAVGRKKDPIVKLIKDLSDKLKEFPIVYIDPKDIWKDQALCQLIFLELKKNGINVRPTIQTLAPKDLLDFLKEENFLDDNVCLRITSDYATSDVINRFYGLLFNHYNLTKEQTLLLIDFEYIAVSLIHLINSFLTLYQGIENIQDISRILVGAGSFPQDLSKFKDGDIGAIERTDLALFNRIKSTANIPDLAFADYCNLHPIYDNSTEKFEGTCSVKYTTDNAFIVFRGKQASKHPQGNQQYVQKCKELMKESYYKGPAFSYGDKCISDCASVAIGPGNAQKWVTYTVNHHITLMAQFPY